MKDENQTFDIAVIGGGPGGYPAAIRAAQLGKKVALIEGYQLGGTCLNRGCIPSKALISYAHTLKKIKNANQFGITVGEVSFDYSKMVEKKDQTVASIRKNLENLIKSNDVTLFKGYGKFINPREIKIKGEDNAIIRAEKTIIATGSEPRNISSFPFDYERIHDSTSILNLKALPKSIIIIGGGIIGCEFASLFLAFGVKVTILEMMPSILPFEEKNMSSAITGIFSKRGIEIVANATVQSVDRTDKGIRVHLSGGKTFDADIALVAVGRKLNTDNVDLEKVGIVLTEEGLVKVNEQMETSTPGIYAIGDIASKWWLAHVATHQGLVAANHAAGHGANMHYNAVPSVIFTDPEIATVGMTLEKAIEKGYNASIGAFPFQALGKAQADLQTEGFAQIVTDTSTGQILGAQVIGYDAATLVAEMAIAITNELTLDCITETIHAHPTVAEIWMEAAMMANETPLHLPPPKRERAKK